jgi:hypothetical protein
VVEVGEHDPDRQLGLHPGARSQLDQSELLERTGPEPLGEHVRPLDVCLGDQYDQYDTSMCDLLCVPVAAQ